MIKESHTLSREQYEKLESAFWSLRELTREEGCYCDDEDCTDEEPLCNGRIYATAMQDFQDAIDPDFSKTLHPSRLVNPPERLYLETWLKENERRGHVNQGFRALEWILGDVGDNGLIKPRRITQHEATIIATFVQWLGTSIGLSFLHAAERAVKDERVSRSKFHTETWNCDFEPAGNPWRDVPMAIAKRFVADSTAAHTLAIEIRRAMEWAKKKALGEIQHELTESEGA